MSVMQRPPQAPGMPPTGAAGSFPALAQLLAARNRTARPQTQAQPQAQPPRPIPPQMPGGPMPGGGMPGMPPRPMMPPTSFSPPGGPQGGPPGMPPASPMASGAPPFGGSMPSGQSPPSSGAPNLSYLNNPNVSPGQKMMAELAPTDARFQAMTAYNQGNGQGPAPSANLADYMKLYGQPQTSGQPQPQYNPNSGQTPANAPPTANAGLAQAMLQFGGINGRQPPPPVPQPPAAMVGAPTTGPRPVPQQQYQV